MKNFYQPFTQFSGLRVSGGVVLLTVAACLLGLGLVGPSKMLRP
jgi:hypothetical protein